jgi:HAD superfamily hydrolase (TIGR01490 family)
MPAADDEIPPSSQAPGVARITGEAAAQATSTALPGEAADEAGVAVPELEAALSVPPDPTAGAFFDVDNTVMRGASIFHLARGLYKRDFFSLRDILGFAWQQLSFLARGENLEHVDQIQAKALGFVAGHSVAELRAVGEEVFDEIMAAKIWPGTKALAQMHLDAGQRVWLVTASPVEVAEVIAHRLGLTGGLGTVAEHVDGVYTGRLVGSLLHGPAKVEAVRALAEREGLDLQRCSAYSDSANDIPLLDLVGNPCAINPDGKLRSYAKAHGWRVRDYRTGRKAARIGIPAAAVAGGLVGAVMGAAAANRRWRTPHREQVRRRPSGAARAARRESAEWSAVSGP